MVATPRHQFNLTTLTWKLNQPAVHDDVQAVWFFGEPVAERETAWQSLQAPDLRSPISMADRILSQNTAAGKSSLSRGLPGEAAVTTCQCGKDSMKN
jgi:hypothetical protein